MDWLDVMGRGNQVRPVNEYSPFSGFTNRVSSALLRAMADKLIPGFPESLKIAILQQKDAFDGATKEISSNQDGTDSGHQKTEGRTVLQTVLQSDISRNEVTRKIKGVCGRSSRQ